ncbi:MAG: DUF1080 domain-containing protein [Verrucomicrobia bacterium]|nr:DUF1080 domain-containing protein [Verrucomicrobiota bacterium]MBT4622481.1 DUF1080 domain-containing protein [Verrucomicrobiota bacterium]
MAFLRHSLILLFLLAIAAGTGRAQTVSGKPVPRVPDANGWFALLNGKDLSGWMTFDPGAWSVVRSGELGGRGPRSYLFSPGTYRNFILEAEARLNAKGDSGIVLRAALETGTPKGYEVQLCNTGDDAQKTGSLYNFQKITESKIADDQWSKQTVAVIGNRILIQVNGKLLVDYPDKESTYTEGHIAFQQHGQASQVNYKNVRIKPLPDDIAAALVGLEKVFPSLGEKKKPAAPAKLN